MTKLLEEAFAVLATMPEDEQNRAARVLLAFATECGDYTFDAEQLAGIDHAIAQADGGELAIAERVRAIL